MLNFESVVLWVNRCWATCALGSFIGRCEGVIWRPSPGIWDLIVRPCSVFCCFRKLWQNVTSALRVCDVTSATEHKSALEEQQRELEKQRSLAGLSVPVAYFVRAKGKDFDTYSFKQNKAPWCYVTRPGIIRLTDSRPLLAILLRWGWSRGQR